MDLYIQTDTEADAVYIGLSEVDRRAHKTVRVNDDVALDFADDGTLLGIDVINATKNFGGPIDEVHLDQLVGVKEAAALVGVQRSNFVRDYADKAGFPAPVVELGTGRIWLRSQVEGYLATRKRRAS